MTPHFYPAIIEPSEHGGWGAWFPDFPGCTSGGDTGEEAAANAAAALELHLAGMVEDGEIIPAPRDPLSLKPQPRGLVALVPAALPGKITRVNISIEEGTLAMADRLAKQQGLSRSGYLASLIRTDMRLQALGRLSATAPARKRRRRKGRVVAGEGFEPPTKGL